MSEVQNQNRKSSIEPNAARWISSSLLALFVFCGCCSTHISKTGPSPRSFDFQRDTFSFPNQLLWEYFYDTNGNWVTRDRDPKPTYWQHCFVLATATKQFFFNARFEPEKPVADDRTYRKLIRQVVSTSLRKPVEEDKRIGIPGYSDLRSFSRAHEQLLKDNCGGAWHSYFQRGHWRIVFPFTRHEQERMSKQLLDHLAKNRLLIIHLVRFPALTINHAVLLFDAKESEKEIQFITYDPNNPEQPRIITYDREKRTFSMAPNDYFPGGRVDVYEVDHKWNY